MIKNFTRLKDCVVTNKNVILRVDINVPVKNGVIIDDSRIRAIIPTLEYLIANKAKIVLISHFGRPEGEFNSAMSLKPIVETIQKLLGNIKINFVDDCIGKKVQQAVAKTNYGEVIILENLRFYKGETKNDIEFTRELAALGNLYVNDAFSCSHRSHASITGIPSILKSAAGFLMEKELDNLQNLLEHHKKPMMAVVGGAKVSTKIDLLKSLVTKAQSLLVGGGMANTFLAAKGKNIGKSLHEKELISKALEIIELAKKSNCEIILPIDVVVAREFKENAKSKNITIEEVGDDDLILDIGQKTLDSLGQKLKTYKTVIWNGPLGAFELKPFNAATKRFGEMVAELTCKEGLISIAGGGDVVAALSESNLTTSFSYISTAGGAFLEWLEGKELPGVKALLK